MVNHSQLLYFVNPCIYFLLAKLKQKLKLFGFKHDVRHKRDYVNRAFKNNIHLMRFAHHNHTFSTKEPPSKYYKHSGCQTIESTVKSQYNGFSNTHFKIHHEQNNYKCIFFAATIENKYIKHVANCVHNASIS